MSALFNFGPAGNPAVPNRFWRCLNISNKDMQINEQIRDREIRVITDAHPQNGLEIMTRFAQELQEESSVEKPAKLEGRSMIMFLAAKPVK